MQPADTHLLSLRDALVGQVLRGSGGVNYYLGDRIGEGGQGWVFRANWDEPGGLLVIVKVLRPDMHGESLPRFQREAEVLRLLSQQARPNPNIVRFYDHAIAAFVRPETNERFALPFTVLEYVNGPTLEQVLRPLRGQGLPTERVRRLVRQVVHALELVHSQKVVHRDLKPSNILLATEQGIEVAKVTDFGLVKLVDLNLQRTTTLAGASLGYAPPEQFEQGNQRVSPKTDIFSLAAIVYEMLTGSLAFPFTDRENALVIVARILSDPRPALARVRAQLSPELQGRSDVIDRIDAILARALQSDPAARHESVTQFWAELEPLLRSTNAAGESAPPSKLPFADTDLARTRPSIGSPTHTTKPSAGNTGALPASHVKLNELVASVGSSGVRLRPLDSAANPAAWTCHVVTRPIKAGLVVGAVFAPDGQSAVASAGALARWERGAWAGLAAPPGIDPRAVRGVRFFQGGDLLVFGDRSLVARLGLRGTCDVWNVPERDLVLWAAHIDDGDLTTLVGERPLPVAVGRPGETVGCVVQGAGSRVAFVSDAPATARLGGVTRFAGGPLVACGDWGSIVRMEGNVAVHVGSVCNGHLRGIVGLADGGGVTVGAGGHALHLTPRLEASLEAVQTTRDILSLAVGGDGVAWAGAAQGRLLRRTADRWVRVSGDVGITSSIVAIWASDRLARAICDDGAVLEWRLA